MKNDFSDVPLDDVLNQLDDVMNHIQFVMKAGHKLIRKLMINEEHHKARELLWRIMAHDRSKTSPDEFYGMAKYSKDVKSMQEPGKGHNPVEEKMKVIKVHWMRNDHHPEFWIDGEIPNSLNVEQPSIIMGEMDELPIMEMCCDWYARSMQFGTNLLEFYESQQNKRWLFNEKQDGLIRKYISMLMED